MRLHIHSPGTPAPLTHPDAAADSRLRELVVVEADEHVYRVGTAEEIDIELTLVEIFETSDHGHVIKHPCHEIKVTADYAGHEAQVTARPGELVKKLRADVIKKLEIDTATAADLVLRLPGQETDLVATIPVGAYATACSLVVNLIHLVRPQG